MSNEQIEGMINSLESQATAIKEEIFKIAWYMRGGVTSDQLFHSYTLEDRKILGKIIADNIELTKKSGMPLL